MQTIEHLPLLPSALSSGFRTGIKREDFYGQQNSNEVYFPKAELL